MTIGKSWNAELDLLEIWSHVARHDFAAADRLAAEIDSTFHLLASAPSLGRRVDQLRPGLRKLPVRGFLVYYMVDGDCLWIVRVLHGSKSITPELFE